MNEPSERPPSQPTPAHSAVTWAMGRGKGEDVISLVQANLQRQRRRRLGQVVGVSVVMAAVGFVWMSTRSSLSPSAVAPASAIVSLPDRRVLPDGSVVELRPGAQIAVDFTDQVRRLTLTSGEAHFQVSKDPARPFVVAATDVEVRAVGTGFFVELAAAAVEVVVTEGSVAIEQKALSPKPLPAPRSGLERKVTLAAGQRVAIERQPAPEAPVLTPTTLTEAELSSRNAWRVPLLEFSETPLAEAVVLFNRYSRDRLVLEPKLNGLRMGGLLRADNTDAFLQLLKDEFGIEARHADGEIHLGRP